MADSELWIVEKGDGPLVAAAVHDGHEVRPEVAEHLALTEEACLREEDPYTGQWATVAGTRIIAKRSRFEVDLNRPRDKAVYLRPEDAWGLKVWKEELPAEIVAGSLLEYDSFYSEAESLLKDIASRHGRFIVFDLHNYNHRRNGPEAPPADPESNPEVNIGTGSMDRKYFGPVVDRFIHDLNAYDFVGRHLDVRENIKFRGGNFSRWIHESFPGIGCSLAIEFKKFYLDEWTGVVDPLQLKAITGALRSTVPGVLEELRKL